jgi:hypothetical protein
MVNAGFAGHSIDAGHLMEARVPKSVMHTVWYQKEDKCHKVFKVGFGGDGSYFVCAPYHPLNTAILGKIQVNYARGKPFTLSEAFDQALELATLDDSDQRLKLSHHPDGFLQFAGTGVVSGRTSAGVPKGIGVRSWSLDKPTFGPSFGVTMHRPELMSPEGDPESGDIVFNSEDLEIMRFPVPGRDFQDLRFSGHYFPPRFRSFLRPGPDGYTMNIVNPESHVVLELKAVLASKECEFPGIIGLAAEPHELDVAGYILSSSTGSLRRNRMGELVGLQLACLYPRPEDFPSGELPSLNYALPAPSYEDTGRPDGVRRPKGPGGRRSGSRRKR